MKKLVKRNLLSSLFLLIVGLFVGYELSNTIPILLLHYLFYLDANSMLVVAVLSLSTIIALALIFLGAKLLGLTKKRARKVLFLGASISAFALAFWAFINYPLFPSH